MTYFEINETHDPSLRSWVESANDPNTDFPIQNLPFCRFRLDDPGEHDVSENCGVVIGDKILNVRRLFEEEFFSHVIDVLKGSLGDHETFCDALYRVQWG